MRFNISCSAAKRIQGSHRDAAYSLLEMSIVVAIVGILMAGFFSVYNVYKRAQQQQTTENNSSVVTSALTNYLIENGHYPCPARLNAGRHDVDYGVSTECDPAKSGYPGLAPGAYANGLYEESGTTASSDYQSPHYMCATVNSGSNLTLAPPGSGNQFVDVSFASYGQPSGGFSGAANDCIPNFVENPLCSAIGSVEKLRSVFKDKTSSTSFGTVNNTAFGGDPCPSVAFLTPGDRRLYVVLKYAKKITGITTAKVRRGMVPFRTLGIPESVAEDGYGMRFQYAVTEPLATDAYTQNGGAITVLDSSHTVAQYVHYVIFSSGEDRAGAYSDQGGSILPCATNTLDAENCNTLSDSSATYRYANFSTAVGSTHFDDYMKYYTSTETPLWRVSSASGFDIDQMNNTKVGIGMDPITTQPAILQVNGEVHSDNNSLAVQLCDKSANCYMTAGAIGNAAGDPNFQCPSGKYISGITDGQVTCVTVPQVGCSLPNTYATGISVDSSGVSSFTCSAVVGCPQDKKNLCLLNGVQDTYVLLAANQGVSTTTSVSGSSYQETWTCSNTGVWQKTGSTGYCACTPADEMTTSTCNSNQPRVGTTSDGNSGRGNWTGSWYYHHVHTCGATQTDTSTYDHKDCVCAPTTYTGTKSCGTGYTGTLTRTEDWVCDSSTSGHYNGWSTYSGTCTCTSVSNQVSTVSCQSAGYGAGYNTGNVTTTKHWICDSGTSGHWDTGTTVDTCTCSAVKGTPYSQGCPDGKVGTVTMQQTYNCATNSWDPAVQIADNCGVAVYYWRSKTAASQPSNNSTGYLQGSTCSTPGAASPCYAPAGGSQYYNYSSCQCE